MLSKNQSVSSASLNTWLSHCYVAYCQFYVSSSPEKTKIYTQAQNTGTPNNCPQNNPQSLIRFQYHCSAWMTNSLRKAGRYFLSTWKLQPVCQKASTVLLCADYKYFQTTILSIVWSLQLVQNIATRLLDNTRRSENVTFKLSLRESSLYERLQVSLRYYSRRCRRLRGRSSPGCRWKHRRNPAPSSGGWSSLSDGSRTGGNPPSTAYTAEDGKTHSRALQRSSAQNGFTLDSNLVNNENIKNKFTSTDQEEKAEHELLTESGTLRSKQDS